MKTTTTILVTALGALTAISLTLTGCGSDSGDGSGAAAMAADDYSLATGEVLCGKIFECCPEGNGFMENEESCVAFIGGFMGESLSQGIDAGMISYDASAAGQCLSEMRATVNSMTCDEMATNDDDDASAFGTACTRVSEGLVTEGGSCAIPQEDDSTLSSDEYCAGDLVCVDDVCVALGQAGDTCTPSTWNEECGPDLYCSADAVCSPLVEAGGDCAQSSDCAAGHYCEALVCTPYLAAGDACSPGSGACGDGNCTDGTCTAPNLCE